MSIEGIIIAIAAVWIGASILALAGFALHGRARRCACGRYVFDPGQDPIDEMLTYTVHTELACYPKEESL